MRVVLQRVSQASVDVGGETVGAIGRGVLLLVGVGRGDTEADADVLAAKIGKLRIFPDPQDGAGRPMDRSLYEVGGSCLVVSQFTLLASVRKGNRPSFTAAEDPAPAAALCEAFAARLRAQGLSVATGRFGASMQVALVNDGPVTILLESQGGRLV